MKNMEIPDLSDLSAFIYYDGDNTVSFFWRYRVSMEKENEMKKEYLLKYRGHVRRINRIEAELSELRTMKLSISVNNDGMPHGSGRSDMSGYAAELDELERNLIQENIGEWWFIRRFLLRSGAWTVKRREIFCFTVT